MDQSPLFRSRLSVLGQPPSTYIIISGYQIAGAILGGGHIRVDREYVCVGQ